jgi:hypothetical protein
VSRIRVEGVTADGQDPTSWQGGSAPSMFAARFTFGWLGGNSLVISTLARYDFKFDASARAIDERSIIPAVPQPQPFAAERSSSARLHEQWFGLTWATRIDERFAGGITQFFAYRSQGARGQTLIQASTFDGADGSSATVYDDYSYWNVRALWKAGLAFSIESFDCGLTITTPSVNMFGDGSRHVNFGTVNVQTPGDTTGSSSIASFSKSGLDARYGSPFSIAAGVSYRLGDTRLHFALEWFDEQDDYVVLDSGTFRSQTTGREINTTLSQELNSVTNFGIGVEHELSERFELFGAFFTDRTAYISAEKTQLSRTNWNIHNVTLGSIFAARSIDFTLGASYGFGSTSNPRLINITSPAAMIADTSDIDFRYDRIKVILGISFPFDDVTPSG